MTDAAPQDEKQLADNLQQVRERIDEGSHMPAWQVRDIDMMHERIRVHLLSALEVPFPPLSKSTG